MGRSFFSMESSNRRRFAHLFAGASLAQLFPFLAAPILTRLYTPEQFATFATFVALAGIWGTIAAARYHMAILLPPDDESAVGLIRLSLGLIGVTSALLTVGLAASWHWMPEVPTMAVLGLWALLVPTVGALLATHETLTNAMIRFDETRIVASSSIARSLASSSIQMALGAVGSVNGLIVGSALGSIAGQARMYVSVRARHTMRGGRINASRILLRRYRKFALLDTPASLANVLSFSLVVLGVGLLYSAHDLGQYALAYRILVLPSALIGTAIGQILIRTLALHRQQRDAQEAKRVYLRFAIGLSAVSLPTFGILLAFGPQLFQLAFGSEWEQAGEIARALSPLLMIRFVASPLSSVFTVHERQGSLLAVQIGILLAASLSLVVGWSASLTIIEMLRLQVLLSGTVYLWVIAHAWRLLGRAVSK